MTSTEILSNPGPNDIESKPGKPDRPGAESHPSTGPDSTVQLNKNQVPVYEKTDYWKFIKEKKYWPWWGVLAVIAVLVILMTVYHRNIVDWLHPVSARIRALSWGWVIPILILIALSVPPLFGHEIIIVLCGAVYGLWIGFGIVAAGTFIGEIMTYFLFLTVLRKRAEKLEQKNLDYAALARITREGGFWIVFIVRLSVIPGHLSTAVFSVCGISFWIFALASLITLPKQIVIVYLGVILGNENGGKTVSDIVLGITFLITVVAGIYIWWRLQKVRKIMISEATIIDKNDETAPRKLSEGEREENLEAAAAENEIRVQENVHDHQHHSANNGERPELSRAQRSEDDVQRYSSFV
ncbi:Tlg2-vesicle protein [Orbilia ellipsospora]|uniref:Golgi apparatus membrane protein TVP38 n=1 Tax=Orbilia ellipsospora TaxID=2528407 RepID=A0AAV9X114_9PEZI